MKHFVNKPIVLSAFPSENPFDLVCVSLKYFRAITSLSALLSNNNLLYFLEDLFIYKIIVEKEKRTFFRDFSYSTK